MIWFPKITPKIVNNINDENLEFFEILIDNICLDFKESDISNIYLKISLFDIRRSHFITSTFVTKLYKTNTKGSSDFKIAIDENIFVYSSSVGEDAFLVIELVSSNSDQILGWSFYKLLDLLLVDDFELNEEEHEFNILPIYICHYYSLLYFDSFKSRTNDLPTLGVQSNISLQARRNKNLQNLKHLVPDNIFIAAGMKIAGLEDWQLLSCQKTVQINVKDVLLNFSDNLMSNFEDEFCVSISQEQNKLFRIDQRNLKVFVHNRWKVVGPIEVIQLSNHRNKTIKELSRMDKTLSGNSNLSTSKILQVKLPNSSEFAIVFVLQFTVTEHSSNGNVLKQPISSSFNVRWGCITPFTNSEFAAKRKALFKIPLRGSGNLTNNVIIEPNLQPEDVSMAVDSNGQQMKQTAEASLADICPDGCLCYNGSTTSKIALQLSCNLEIIPDQPLNDLSLENASTVDENEALALENQPNRNIPVPEIKTTVNKVVESTPLINSIRPQAPINQISDQGHTLAQYPQPQQQIFMPSYSANQIMNQGYNSAQYPYPQQQIAPPQWPYYYPPPPHMMYGGASITNTTSAPLVYEPLDPVRSRVHPFIPGGVGQTLDVYRTHGLSQVSVGQLYASGFEPIVTDSGKNPDIVDENAVNNFSMQNEIGDLLSCNKIIFQFLALTTSMQGTASLRPFRELLIAFRFYRFSKTTTQFLKLAEESIDFQQQNNSICFLLRRTLDAKCNQSMDAPPGCKIEFDVDSSFLRLGEEEHFIKYLRTNSVHVEVWSADSMMLVGTTSVELKHLCRQGREAVQITYAADLLQPTDWMDDEQDDGSSPIVNDGRLLGQLHVRLANVGYRDPNTTALRRTIRDRPKRSRLIAMGQPGTISGFYGGALSNTFQQLTLPTLSTKPTVVRARRAVDVYSELEDLLCVRNQFESSRSEPGTDDKENGTNERQRRLARFRAARQATLATAGKQNSNIADADPEAKRTLIDRNLELSTIDIFREKIKNENISMMLMGASRMQYTLHITFGSTEFFEFELFNPEDHEEVAEVLIDDQRGGLKLVTDVQEVHTFKSCYDILTPTDDSLFAFNYPLQSASAPGDLSFQKKTAEIVVCLKPKERIRVPLKYLEKSPTFLEDFEVLNAKLNSEKNNAALNPSQKARCEHSAMITFKSIKSNHTIGQLRLQIFTYPPIIDQSFHFFTPELSFLKRVIRLPSGPAPTITSISTTVKPPLQKVWTRVSDPGVITESSMNEFGKPIDLLVKVSTGASPDVRKFLLAVYVDPYQLKPAYIWYWSVQSLHRVDVSATLGLPTLLGLLIRGDGGGLSSSARRVAVFSSHPTEVSLGSELSVPTTTGNGGSSSLEFLLSNTAVYELKVIIRPASTGRRKYQLNVVDQTTHSVVQAWILCVEVKAPETSRSYEIKIPSSNNQASGSANLNKRLSYTNPYPHQKRLTIETNKMELLEIKERNITVNAGETIHICLKFNSQPVFSKKTCYVFLTDEDGKLEDAFILNIEYF